MSDPDLVPPEIAELLIKFRDKKISKIEEAQLYRWIMGMKNVPGFNLHELTTAGFGFSENDYRRLTGYMTRYRKKVKVKAEDELRRLENQDFARFIETMWNEVKTIATDVVMGWAEKAKNMGYYDPEQGKTDMKRFIEDAINFYVENKDRIEEYEERLRDVEAAGQLAFKLADPNIAKIYVVNAYTRFCSEVLKLAALGIPVPESIILDVKETVNRAITSLKPPLMRGVDEHVS